MVADRGISGDSAWAEEVTIFPEPAPSPDFYMGIGIALLTLPLIVMGILFVKAGPDVNAQPLSQPSVFKAVLNDEENPLLIRSDLLEMRRNILSRVNYSKEVYNAGIETRIFSYFSVRMAPNVCPDLRYLELSAPKPGRGFELTGICRNGILDKLKMEVSWTGRTAIVRFPGISPHQEEIELFPLDRWAAQAGF